MRHHVTVQSADGGQEVIFTVEFITQKSKCLCFTLFIVVQIIQTIKPQAIFTVKQKLLFIKGEKMHLLTGKKMTRKHEFAVERSRVGLLSKMLNVV